MSKYKSVQCPCCDYYSLSDKGEYSICKVCFWEDDGLDIDSLDTSSSPNRMTLREARANFKSFGACDKDMLKNLEPISSRKNYKLEIRNI
jgi:hypothetical protein